MSESHLQSAVVQYIKLQYPFIRYCATMGGQYQPYKSQRMKMKHTGFVKGIPDLIIYEARGGYFGFFIEIKTLKGYPTKEQKQWIEDLNKRGYLACCLKGLDSIISAIDVYFKLPPTKQSNESSK